MKLCKDTFRTPMTIPEWCKLHDKVSTHGDRICKGLHSKNEIATKLQIDAQ